ncbi:hypothetical protein GVN16_08755 [Emticicia sp. CRIBPO]|uniref:hypothetical protein n=1 Tax=Emticicia sp. CRIBPO TaxID=2683258 RepID=UPI001412CFAC|nr:hypothetical protein [Emticicia sp. CRIBPO]NBA85846.1 hypothetical protein [Emticicia sp. CRIBPO]
MTNSIFKSVLFGLLLGAALFFLPVFILGIFIFATIARLLFFRSMRRRYWGAYQFADRVRSMSDEEFHHFRNHGGRSNHHQPITIHL